MELNSSSSSAVQGAALYGWLRTKWAAGFTVRSDVAFAVGVSILWAILYNFRFWQATADAMWRPSFGAALFFVSLFCLVVCAQAILVLLAPTRLLMRILTSALFVVAAVTSYFVSAYGALMNEEMMRNVLETDPAEVRGLISMSLLLHALFLGFLPAILVWRVSLPPTSWRTQLKQRGWFGLAALAIIAAGLFAYAANYAVFFREHKPIRLAFSPSAPIASTVQLLARKKARDPKQPLIDPAGNVQRLAGTHPKPVMIFLVIGETARAANFELGGYERATNPNLRQQADLVYFDHATSCGTATATSVPCIFSHLPRERFDVDTADRYTNLLDSLVKGGFSVEWRDNNAGCKGVCERVQLVNYVHRHDANFCPYSYCFDEVMLTDLARRLETVHQDTVLVFHQIGSHGPAYSERYPPQFERFKPVCRSNELQHCTSAEIVNAYDNSIAYTDYVLARQIALLQASAERVDSVLIYASDHGESLGEQGVYLHGMPYRFAPRVQKEIPMLIWASSGYAADTGVSMACLREHSQAPVSHDNLYHTVLGAAQLRNQVYNPDLDLFAACRSQPRPAHE